MKIWIAFLLLSQAFAAGTAAAGGLPEPTGEYTVGMTRYAFLDTARPELFTEDPDDRREVTVTVWYPDSM